MKTLSMMKESWSPNQTIGVMNHLTPVQNIITNINNFFASQLSIVAEPGKDNVSILVHSSFFYDKDTTYRQLYLPVWNDKVSLASYVAQQGLNNIKVIPTGNAEECMVLFCPSDMPQMGYNGPCDIGCEPKCACESKEIEYDQFTFEEGEDMMNGIKNYGFGDQEIESIQKKDLREILSSKDKVKAAKMFDAILKNNMRMPDNYYIKAVRDEDGNESIALRYRYEKKKPFGKTVTMTKSIVNIYNTEDGGIWVDDAENLPEEMKGVVDDMLNFVGVRRTGDPNSFSVSMTDDFDDLKADPNDMNTNDENSNPEGDNDATADDNKEGSENGIEGNDNTNTSATENTKESNSSDNSAQTPSFSRSDGSSM